MRNFLYAFLLTATMLPNIATASEADTLIWGRGGETESLDLAQATGGGSIKAGIQILENLVQFGDNNMDVEPQLATSWTTSDDGLTWTFKLREDVRFHDGEPFNAKAVYESFARIIDKDHPLHGYGKWRYLSLSLKPVKSINIVDNYTIQLVTEKPFAPLLNNLALWLCPIISPKAMYEYKDQIGQHPVGTGPFKFVSWVKKDQIVFKRYDDYWGDNAKVENLILKFIPSPTDRLMALQSGKIDIADDLDPKFLKLIKKNPNLDVIEKPSVNIGYLAINTQKNYLKDPNIRIALNHAIDKKSIIDKIFQGMAIPAKNPFPPSIYSYNDSIQPYEYNPVKAKQMLKKAGFDFNRVLELWAMPVSRAYMPDPVKTAELIQSYLALAGVKSKIIEMDWVTYLKRTGNGDHDLCMFGWLGGNVDPDNFLYGLLSSDAAKTPAASNVALWKNKEFTKLCKDAQGIFDKNERTKNYMEAQVIAHNEAPWIPLVHTTITRCYSKKLSGVPLRPNGLNSFQMVSKQ